MERRKTTRIPMFTSAQVRSLGRWTHATVVDLSFGGAQLGGDELPAQGARARVQLSLAGHAVCMEVTAAWRRPGARRTGVTFDPLSAPQRRAIADALLRVGHRDHEDKGTIVLAVNGSPCFEALADAIRARGFAHCVASSPVDALRQVRDAAPPICAAIVAPASDGRTDAAVLDVLAAEHPAVRRVLLIEGETADATVAEASADRVLLSPWTDDDLEAMFDVIGHRAAG